MLTEEKLNNLLRERFTVRDEISDCKVLLKSYKIESEKLNDLKKVRRDLSDEIKAEKARIEGEFMEDSDFRDCTERSIKLKERSKELAAQIQALAATMTDKPLTTFKVEVEGQPAQIDIEKVARVHLNGKEIR